MDRGKLIKMFFTQDEIEKGFGFYKSVSGDYFDKNPYVDFSNAFGDGLDRIAEYINTLEKKIETLVATDTHPVKLSLDEIDNIINI